jgi:hypothetical protein
MPDASTQTEQGIAPTRKPISDSTKKKYDQAIKRIEDAKLNLDKPKEVIAWIRTKGEGSAQKTYLSAIKYHLGFRPKPFHFPVEYQREIDTLFGRQSEKDTNQELSTKQVENFVPYSELLDVQRQLADMEKDDSEWRSYVIASLYTLNAPVRADYGEMRVFGREDSRRTTGNELIWRKKKPVFIFREYKTSKDYGPITIPVSKELAAVIGEWFGHLGATPKYLLNDKITPNYLLRFIEDAFVSTGKKVGVNILRHAYIQFHLPAIATNTVKRQELATRMLHSVERQQVYFPQNV